MCQKTSLVTQTVQDNVISEIVPNVRYLKKRTIKPKAKKLNLLDRNVVKVRTNGKVIKIVTNHKSIHKRTRKFVKKYRINECFEEESTSGEDSVEIKAQS